MNSTEPPIFVSSEWGELKECVYGWAGQFIWPKFLQDAELRPTGGVRQMWFDHQERSVEETCPEFFAEWKSQIDGAVAFLEDQGIKVHQPVEQTAANLKFPRGENHGAMTGWLRDPFVTIGNNVIELAPRSLFHRRQRFSVRHILAATMDRGARYFSQPDCGADDSLDGPGWGYLEGGDIFVLGTNILVGHSGHCSNREGARWLQHALGPDYDVEVADLDPSCFQHLDCVLCTPREGVAIACTDAFIGGLPRHIRGWDIIDVSKELCNDHLGTNHLVLNDHTIIVPAEEAHDTVAEELKQRRFEVIRLPYEAVYRCGGSFRCAHQPLIRR
jgi:glycine amidinotransferase